RMKSKGDPRLRIYRTKRTLLQGQNSARRGVGSVTGGTDRHDGVIAVVASKKKNAYQGSIRRRGLCVRGHQAQARNVARCPGGAESAASFQKFASGWHEYFSFWISN